MSDASSAPRELGARAAEGGSDPKPLTSDPSVGVGVSPPPGYSSNGPLGNVYAELTVLWQFLNQLESSDGTVGGGLAFQKNKDALLDAITKIASDVQSADQYEQKLLAYGTGLRAQVVTLQAQCGGSSTPTTTTTPATPGTAPGAVTPKAAGAIALGSLLLGGILGFAGAKMLPEDAHPKE